MLARMEDFMYIFLWVLFIVIIVIGLLFYLIMPGKSTSTERAPFQNRNIAHRGLHTKDKKIPENSMAAFKNAVKHRYGIELDIQLTKDEQVVVFHDKTLNRVCNIDGRVDAYTYEELLSFSLHKTKEQIPLFQDVLSMVNGQVPLIVELKTGSRNQLLCEKAYELLKQYKGNYCIESFDPFIVQWFRKNAPHIFRGQLSSCPRSLKKDNLSWIKAFFLGNLLCNVLSRPQFIAYDKTYEPILARIARKMVSTKAVWTIKDTDDYRKYQSENDIVIFELYKPLTKW